MNERQSSLAAAHEQRDQTLEFDPLQSSEGTRNPVPPGAADPYEQLTTTPELTIRHTTFEQAQQARRPLSDVVIDASVNQTPLVTKNTRMGLRKYLAATPTQESDRTTIDNP